MLVYKIDVLQELKKKGYNTTRLRNDKIIGEAQIQKIRKNEMVGIIILEKICDYLEMQPGDIIAYQKGTKETKQSQPGKYESQCKTCKNIFDFPKCCTENLTDCVKVIGNCKNYDEIE